MKSSENWEIDREPTKRERLATIIICIITGAVSYLAIIFYMKEKGTLLTGCFFYTLFLLSLWILLRALFSRSAKPSSIGLMAMGSFFIMTAVFLIFIPIKAAYSSYYIITGLSGGITIFLHGYRKVKKP